PAGNHVVQPTTGRPGTAADDRIQATPLEPGCAGRVLGRVRQATDVLPVVAPRRRRGPDGAGAGARLRDGRLGGVDHAGITGLAVPATVARVATSRYRAGETTDQQQRGRRVESCGEHLSVHVTTSAFEGLAQTGRKSGASGFRATLRRLRASCRYPP